MFGLQVSLQQGLTPRLPCTSPALTMHHLLSSSGLFDRVRPSMGWVQHEVRPLRNGVAIRTHLYHSNHMHLLFLHGDQKRAQIIIISVASVAKFTPRKQATLCNILAGVDADPTHPHPHSSCRGGSVALLPPLALLHKSATLPPTPAIEAQLVNP